MAKKEKDAAHPLVEAMSFVSLAQRDSDVPYQTHVAIYNRTIVGYDGTLAAGALIDVDISACPHTATLNNALKKCAGSMELVQLDNARISIKSGGFKVMVPCIPFSLLNQVSPDPMKGPCDERLRMSLLALSPFLIENSHTVMASAALVNGQTASATDGKFIVQVHHGVAFDKQLVIPKLFITALGRVAKPIIGYGQSGESLTVYFDDRSWLKTQLYRLDRFPDVDRILAQAKNAPVAPPDGFFEALKVVESFVVDGRIRLRPGRIQSHDTEHVGASHEFPGLTATVALNAKQLLLVEKLANLIDIQGTNNITYFYGENVRGCMAQVKE